MHEFWEQALCCEGVVHVFLHPPAAPLTTSGLLVLEVLKAVLTQGNVKNTLCSLLHIVQVCLLLAHESMWSKTVDVQGGVPGPQGLTLRVCHSMWGRCTVGVLVRVCTAFAMRRV